MPKAFEAALVNLSPAVLVALRGITLFVDSNDLHLVELEEVRVQVGLPLRRQFVRFLLRRFEALRPGASERKIAFGFLLHHPRRGDT